MKKNICMVIATTTVVAFGAGLVSVSAEVDKKAIQTKFNGIPAAEMPFEAAKMVAKAARADKEATALAVLKAAVVDAKKPGACVSLVGGVSSIAPQVAPRLAAEAVKLTPQYLADIARVASKAAPAQIDKITIALLKALKSGKDKTTAVRSILVAVPTSVAKINQGIAAVYPAGAGGTIKTLAAPIAALKPDGTIDTSATAVFPDDPPTAVEAQAGIDPARYNAP